MVTHIYRKYVKTTSFRKLTSHQEKKIVQAPDILGIFRNKIQGLP